MLAVRTQARERVAAIVAGERPEGEPIDNALPIDVSEKYSLSGLCVMVLDAQDETREVSKRKLRQIQTTQLTIVLIDGPGNSSHPSLLS